MDFWHFAKTIVSHAIKTASKKVIQSTAEGTVNLTGNKIANKINVSKKSSKELHSQNEDELEIPKERYISPEKRTNLFNKLLMN